MTTQETALYRQLLALTPNTIDYTVDGKCSGCGQCCSNFLPMTEAEIQHIRQIVRRRGLKPHTRIVIPMAHPYDATCPFLDGENRCGIYEDRPFICQSFICSKPARDYLAPDERRWYAQNPRTVAVREEFFGERSTS
jgi:hypothetical protein